MRNYLKGLLMIALAVGVLAGIGVSTANADPLLTGSYSISGNYVAVNGQTGAMTALGSATGIDFVPLVGSFPVGTPGVNGQFLVNSASGNFAFLTGATGSIRDFSFAGLGSANYPITPLLAFESVSGVTFDLLTSSIAFQNINSLVVEGTGIFHFAGFDPTPGTFTFSANQAGTTFSFSASHNTVPEPTSMFLLGTGLLGLAGAARRKFRKV